MLITEIPDEKTIFQALKERYFPKQFKFTAKTTKIEATHNLDLQKLKKSVDDSLNRFGNHPWKSMEGEDLKYTGFSLRHNPCHQDNLDPHSSSLGTPKNKRSEFFAGSTLHHEKLKNSYFDTYGFCEPTLAAQNGYLGEILASCKRSLIRSRMMIVNGDQYTEALIQKYKEAKPGDSLYGWHRDEPIFENLRINIPITGDESFVFEMQNQAPYILELGKAYTWDTHIPHRVYCTKPTKLKRYNLVIGVSPWFDYDSQSKAWKPNAFFLKKDPQAMIQDGDVFDWLKCN